MADSMKSPYNAYFEFSFSTNSGRGTERVYVVVQRFGYSWRLMQSGESQSRQHHVLYPKRVERTELNTTLVFRNIDEYIAFGKFMRDCHVEMTSMSDPPDLFFISSAIKPYAKKGATGEALSQGVHYSVAVKSVPMKVAVDTVAPTLQLTMEIIRDMHEIELDGGIGIASWESGAEELSDPSSQLAVNGGINGGIYPSDVESAPSLQAADDAYRSRK